MGAICAPALQIVTAGVSLRIEVSVASALPFSRVLRTRVAMYATQSGLSTKDENINNCPLKKTRIVPVPQVSKAAQVQHRGNQCPLALFPLLYSDSSEARLPHCDRFDPAEEADMSTFDAEDAAQVVALFARACVWGVCVLGGSVCLERDRALA